MSRSPSGAECAQAVIVSFQRLRRRYRQLGEPDGLTPSLRSVLARLEGRPAAASELAATERVRPQSMATIVAELERLELVRRTADPDDGRRRIVSLTERGTTWVRGNRSVRMGWLADALDQQCSSSERETLLAAARILERVSES